MYYVHVFTENLAPHCSTLAEMWVRFLPYIYHLAVVNLFAENKLNIKLTMFLSLGAYYDHLEIHM